MAWPPWLSRAGSENSTLTHCAKAWDDFTPANMADQYDIVVAGAGHNSLVAAAYLAKAGYRCLVLEGRPIVGGDVKSAELTLRGFVHDTCSSAHNVFHSSPIFQNDE